MTTTKNEVIETKSIELKVIEADSESVFVKIQDWRMRVYFEDNAVNPIEYYGKLIKVEYVGDIENVLDLKILPLKTK